MLKENKKAQKKALAAMILILFSTVMIMLVLRNMTDEMLVATDETQCRLSVMQRALNPIDQVYTSSLQCRTRRKDLSDEDENEKEDVMREISELSMSCWNMFGQGVLRSMHESSGALEAFGNHIQGSNPLGIYSERAFCFVCNDVQIMKDMEGDDVISEGELRGYMENTIFATDDSGFDICDDRDITDEECNQLQRENADNNCELRGGTCRTQCGTGELEQDDPQWSCGDAGGQCCISRQKAYSYMDYLRYDSSTRGDIDFYPEGNFQIEQGESYGIVYVEPISREENSKILITNMNEVPDSGCTVR